MRNRDRFAAVLPALRANVLGRIAGADDQDVLVLELQSVTEVMRMQHPAVEGIETLKFRHVGRREMPGSHHHIVELLRVLLVVGEIMRNHREFLRAFVERYPPHRRAEADPLAYIGFLHAAFDIIEQHRTRWIGCDLFAEMLLEAVVGKLQPFLWAVRPQVAVHRAMHRLAILIESGAPCVIPQAAPIVLLLKTYDFRDVSSLLGSRLQGPQLRQARRPRTDDCYAFAHLSPPPV